LSRETENRIRRHASQRHLPVQEPEIKALHLTWIAFFICFYVWFNMAPLASSMLRSVDWLTRDDIRLFAIANVALTIPRASSSAWRSTNGARAACFRC
jgi:nitrate/nitrite transporter NarK